LKKEETPMLWIFIATTVIALAAIAVTLTKRRRGGS
jgi:hypothetical protein